MSNKKRVKALAKLKSMTTIPTRLMAISDELTKEDMKETAEKIYTNIMQQSIDLTAEDRAILNSILCEEDD